jgi:hypothetical protein
VRLRPRHRSGRLHHAVTLSSRFATDP